MNDAVRLAQRLHDSRMFSAYGTPQAVLSTLLLGREIGLPAMASLRSVHVIEGKHSLSADLMVALVLKSGFCRVFPDDRESTDKICTFETKRSDAPKPTRISYTKDEAEKADFLRPGKGKPSPWHKMPNANAPRPRKVRAGAVGVPGPARGPLHAGRTAGRERGLTMTCVNLNAIQRSEPISLGCGSGLRE